MDITDKHAWVLFAAAIAATERGGPKSKGEVGSIAEGADLLVEQMQKRFPTAGDRMWESLSTKPAGGQ